MSRSTKKLVVIVGGGVVAALAVLAMVVITREIETTPIDGAVANINSEDEGHLREDIVNLTSKVRSAVEEGKYDEAVELQKRKIEQQEKLLSITQQKVQSNSTREVFVVSTPHNIRLGMSYEEAAASAKALRSSGVAKEVHTGTLRAGWKPGARSIVIEFAERQTFDLGLTIPTEKLTLYSEDDTITGITIDYGFKANHAADVFDSLASDVARFLGEVPSIETREDEVGNRTRFSIGRKGQIRLSIEDNIDGAWAAFAPDLRIDYAE